MELGVRLDRIEEAHPLLYSQKHPLLIDHDAGVEKTFSLLCIYNACGCVLVR
jgi:hypothetical protein